MRSPKKLCGMQSAITILTTRIAEPSAAIEDEGRQKSPNVQVVKTLFSQRVAMLVRRADMTISYSTQVRVARNTQTP